MRYFDDPPKERGETRKTRPTEFESFLGRYGGDNPEILEAQNYSDDWLGSDKVKRIGSRDGVDYAGDYMNRLNNTRNNVLLNDNSILLGQSNKPYHGYFNTVRDLELNPDQYFNEKAGLWSTQFRPKGEGRSLVTKPSSLIHERAHTSSIGENGNIPREQINHMKFQSQGKDWKLDDSYLTKPGEIQARVNVLRSELQKRGIDINQDHKYEDKEFRKVLNEIKESGINNIDQIKELYNDKELIYLLNNIVRNESNPNQNDMNGFEDQWNKMTGIV